MFFNGTHATKLFKMEDQYIPQIYPKKGFTFTLQLYVDKSVSFEHGYDMYKQDIYNTYRWALNTINCNNELIDELLDDIINVSDIPVDPSDSKSTFTRSQLGEYVEKYNLHKVLIEIITDRLLSDMNVNTIFDSNEASITFTVKDINTDITGDIDRFIYSLKYKLAHSDFNYYLGSSSYDEGKTFMLFEKQCIDIHKFIDMLKENDMLCDDTRLQKNTIELHSCWGVINYRRGNIEIRAIE